MSDTTSRDGAQKIITDFLADDVAYLVFGNSYKNITPGQRASMLFGTVDLAERIYSYGIQERIDEHALWKPVAEEIVEKDGVYRAVNFLNKRAQELTALRDKEQ